MSEDNKNTVKPATKRMTACLVLPIFLHNQLWETSIARKTSISSMVESWIEKYVSLQDVSFGLVAAMNSTGNMRPSEPQTDSKKLTVSLSKKHYGMLKMESVRRGTSIRSVLRDFAEENIQEQLLSQDEKYTSVEQVAE